MANNVLYGQPCNLWPTMVLMAIVYYGRTCNSRPNIMYIRYRLQNKNWGLCDQSEHDHMTAWPHDHMTHDHDHVWCQMTSGVKWCLVSIVSDVCVRCLLTWPKLGRDKTAMAKAMTMAIPGNIHTWEHTHWENTPSDPSGLQMQSNCAQIRLIVWTSSLKWSLETGGLSQQTCVKCLPKYLCMSPVYVSCLSNPVWLSMSDPLCLKTSVSHSQPDGTRLCHLSQSVKNVTMSESSVCQIVPCLIVVSGHACECVQSLVVQVKTVDCLSV